ncbi:MAG TPA: lytic transglycosylase domain-containing protein [Myxococcales bacterium]
MLAAVAGLAGAAVGVVKQPDPDRREEDFAWTAGAAVAAAHGAEARARDAEARAADAERKLAALEARLETLSGSGAEQELTDAREAERLGVARLMKDSTALWGDDRRRVMAAVVRESRKNGLDPLLTAAVIQVESHFDPFAVSGAGARGLMQLMPPTAQWLLARDADARNDRLRAAALFNPVLNIELGTAYLAQLLHRFDGDLTTALIAYNAGPGTARSLRRGSRAWRRLEGYPKNVIAAYRSLLTPPEQIAAR